MAGGDTEIGGRDARFPNTRMSAVREAASGDEACRQRALGTLIAAYWKPAYKYVRLRWKADNEQAKDLVQGFFAGALGRATFARYDAAKGSFRTFLRHCLDDHVRDQRDAQRAAKRGGGATVLPLDFEGAEAEMALLEPRDREDHDACFQREWVRQVFALAVAALRELCAAQGKEGHFELFRRYDLEPDPGAPPSYAALAVAAGLPVTQVTNHLAWARREFRRLVLDRLRELTGSEAEFREEARALLGITFEEPRP